MPRMNLRCAPLRGVPRVPFHDVQPPPARRDPKNGYNWWFNSSWPSALSIASQAKLESYKSADQLQMPSGEISVAINYGAMVRMACSLLLDRPCASVIEFGPHGCLFTLGMQLGLEVFVVDALQWSVDQCVARGVPVEQTLRHDLRKSLPHDRPGKRFDIALCTEMAEHVEPPFSSMVVHNLVRHSDLVWFSTEQPVEEFFFSFGVRTAHTRVATHALPTRVATALRPPPRRCVAR